MMSLVPMLAYLLFYTNVAEPHNIVRMKPGYISKYAITTYEQTYSISVNASYDLYLKKAIDGDDEALDAVVKNLNMTKTKMEGRSFKSSAMPGNAAFKLNWNGDGTASDPESLLRGLLDYNHAAVSKARDENLTRFELDLGQKMDCSESICTREFAVLDGSEIGDEFMEMIETADSNGCESIDPEVRWTKSLTGPAVRTQLFKDDYTIKRKIYEYSETSKTSKKVLKQEYYTASFVEFIPLESNLKLFTRTNPIRQPLMDPKQLLPFENGYDLRYSVHFSLNNAISNLISNCHFTYHLRDAGDNRQMFGRGTKIVCDRSIINQLQNKRIKKGLKKAMVLGFDDRGSLVYKDLESKKFHPNRFDDEGDIQDMPIYSKSFRLDYPSIEFMRNGTVNSTTYLQDFMIPFIDFKAEYKTVMAYDMDKFETHLSISPQENDENDTKYALCLNQTLSRNDFKVVKLLSLFNFSCEECANSGVNGRLVATLEEKTPRKDADADVFNFNGEVLDERYFE